jgi:hypothetical protein
MSSSSYAVKVFSSGAAGSWMIKPGIWNGNGSSSSGFVVKVELDAAAERHPDLIHTS